MNSLSNSLVLAVVFLALFAPLGVDVEACSIVQVPELPRSRVDPAMYIMVGEVIGYTNPVTDPENFRGDAVGLRVKPVESIHFPYHQNDYVEVFMFGHGADCFPEPARNIPKVGSRLRLALQEARLVANRSGSHVRLESRMFDRISTDETIFGYSTKAETVFDYERDFRSLAEKFGPAEMADQRRWLADFLYIEASKDLLRLQRATTEQERMEILKRLLYCPDIDYASLLSSEFGIAPAERFVLAPLRPGSSRPSRPDIGKLSKAKQQLLKERMRLEYSGELNPRKNSLTR